MPTLACTPGYHLTPMEYHSHITLVCHLIYVGNTYIVFPIFQMLF